MRIALILAAALILLVPASGQTITQKLSGQPLKVTKVKVVSPAAIFATETPEMCVARNKYLREKTIPKLQSQLASLQGDIAARKAQVFDCSADGYSSVSAAGVSTDCGAYACNPVDGLCRSWAKTTMDCGRGFLWDGYRSCVPAP